MANHQDTRDVVRVESESLHAVGYAPETQTLLIIFRNGSTYRYLRVPDALYRGLLEAASRGRFFNNSIRSLFEFERLS